MKKVISTHPPLPPPTTTTATKIVVLVAITATAMTRDVAATEEGFANPTCQTTTMTTLNDDVESRSAVGWAVYHVEARTDISRVV